MFFYLSKLFSFLVTPLAWIFILLLLTLLTHDKKRKKLRLIWTFLFFLFFTNLYIAETTMKFWEPKQLDKKDLYKTYEVGIVLSGGMVFATPHDNMVFKHNIDRILQAVFLYKNGYIKRILISGGNGTLRKDKSLNEAILLQNFLLQLGIPQKDILIDSLSKNTHENAVYSVELLKKYFPNGTSVLLITSASHMLRSFACFAKAGLIPDVYPVDFHTGTKEHDVISYILPNVEALVIWQELLHEWIGIFTYYLMGYI
jgi:uncharacterized SAM-binding protein YcdF (DUF218 family)